MQRFIFFTLLLALALNAFGATTATLIIKGTVPELLDIVIVPEAIASNLPLSLTQSNTKIASVTEQSNSNTGYKVLISSSNLGKLKRDSGTEEFPYVLSYDGQTLDLSTEVTLIRAGAVVVNAVKDLNISYTGVEASTMVAGDYTDTITFSIAAN